MPILTFARYAGVMGTRTRRAWAGRAALAAIMLMPGVAAPALAADSSASGRAAVVTPLSIVNTRALDFGRLVPGAAAGTVVIAPATDIRTVTGGATAAGGTTQAAQFLTLGQSSFLLQITRGPLPVLSRVGGGATMNVTALTLNGPALRFFPPNNVIDLRVGGTLAVAANQLPGTYTGTFVINANYF